MTSYIGSINECLRPKSDGKPLVIDLFAGCGGLSLGFEAQGFATLGYEMDEDCCATYRKNLLGKCEQAVLTPETDLPKADIVIGGPPCQPFSVGGHQLGLKDARDGFPSFLAAIKKIQPEIWMFENVRGLLYGNRWYFDEILHALKALGYVVEFQLLNAVDYGVPQNRERVIVVGHRGDFQFPKLQNKKVTAGEALADILYRESPDSKYFTPSMDAYVAKYEKASFCVRPRDLHLNIPSRTLTCRNLAGATGDMHRIKLPDGRRRRLLLREAARLQSFPDYFEFVGGETSCFNQIGNAVSPLFAYNLAGSVRQYLESSKRLTSSEIVYKNLPDQLVLPITNEPALSDMTIPDLLSTSDKPKAMRKLLNEALLILSKFGVPLDGLTDRRLESMAMVFCAVANVRRSADWTVVGERIHEKPPTTRDLIGIINAHFGENISSGSYDDIRRKHLLFPVVAGIIVKSAANPNAARNSPTRGFAIAPEYAALIRGFGTQSWSEDVEEFMADRPSLSAQLAQERAMKLVPVTLPNGKKLEFSPGEHNQLQKAIIEDFLPRYGYGSEVLYVGDTAKKLLMLDAKKLKKLKFFEIGHGELPDVITYSHEKNWLYLIEAVHSSGPISPVRLLELQKLSGECTADIVFVTAFLNRNAFRKYAPEIAWETEVWIADAPDHLIHFDGHNFLGPYKKPTRSSK